jgi:hypothetical protein
MAGQMTNEIQKLRNDLAAVDMCISGCRDKVRNANAEYFLAKKNGERELIACCEQRVKEAMQALEENLKKREQLLEQLNENLQK